MKNYSRRDIVTASAAAIAAAPLIALSSRAGLAAGAPQLDPDDAQARALSYAHTSSKAGQNCANCQLYTGDAAAEWGPCAIFPGRQVASAGWCSAWVKKTG